MKKILGYILIAIPILNVVAIIGSNSGGRESSSSPLEIIFLILMFFGGIALISKSSKNKEISKTDE